MVGDCSERSSLVYLSATNWSGRIDGKQAYWAYLGANEKSLMIWIQEDEAKDL